MKRLPEPVSTAQSPATAPWTIVQLLPALQTGGAERSALEVSRALVAAGHRSIVISAGGRWQARLEAEGGEHHSLDLGSKTWRAALRVGELARLLNRLRPDLVHARSRLPAWIYWYARRKLLVQPRFVTTVHGLNSVNPYSAILTRGERVIAVSRCTREHLLRHYPKLRAADIRVIPRGVDPAEFPADWQAPAGKRAELEALHPQLKDLPWLTLPGRGTRLKGHADAIKLLARLKQDGTHASLLLLGVVEAGRESYLAELELLAQRLGVRERVAFSPSRSDVRDVMSLSAIVLQLSTRPESFGRVVVEALSLGRPVLGYAHGGVGELLAEHYPQGAVPLGDVQGAARRVASLLREAPAPIAARLPTVAQLQARSLSVYAELLAGAAVDPALCPS